MTFTSMEHLGHGEMPAKNAEAFKKLQETRRAELLGMAKKMKLDVPGHPASQVDLVNAIAKKRGLFDG